MDILDNIRETTISRRIKSKMKLRRYCEKAAARYREMGFTQTAEAYEHEAHHHLLAMAALWAQARAPRQIDLINPDPGF